MQTGISTVLKCCVTKILRVSSETVNPFLFRYNALTWYAGELNLFAMSLQILALPLQHRIISSLRRQEYVPLEFSCPVFTDIYTDNSLCPE